MTKSAVRTLEILEAVGNAGLGMSHGAISKALGIPKGSLTALLKELSERRYLEIDRGTGLFTLGPQILSLANSFIKQFDPIRMVIPEVARLSQALGEAVHIAIKDKDDILVIHHETGRHTLSAVMRIGDRAPLAATAAGRALMAYLDENEQRRLVEDAQKKGFLNSHASATPLDKIKQGAVSVIDQTWIEGVAAFALPLFEPSSASPFAAISVALPSSRVNPATTRTIETALQELGKSHAPTF